MPNINIGDVEVATINSIEDNQSETTVEIDAIGLEDPVVVEMDPGLIEFDIPITLVKSVHTNDKNIYDQRVDIKSLVRRKAGQNAFDYLDWTGWLSIEDVDVPIDEDTRNIINGTITAQYLPEPEYDLGDKVLRSTTTNDYSIDRPGVVSLPAFVHNIRLRNPANRIDEPLSSIATDTNEDGDFDIYDILGWYHAQYGDNNSGGTRAVKPEFSALESYNLSSQGDKVENTGITNQPLGEYSLVVRLQDDDVADDIRLVVHNDDTATDILSETVSTGTTNITTVTSSKFTLTEGISDLHIRVEKETTDSNTIEVDGYYLKPNYPPEIMYDAEVGADLSTESSVSISGQSFNVPDRVGNVKVYDDQGSNTESDWVRVHNEEYVFDNNIVVSNGIVRYRPSDETIWVYDAGGTWTQITQSNNEFAPDDAWIKYIGPEKVSLGAFGSASSSGAEWQMTMTIRRGSYLVEQTFDQVDNGSSGVINTVDTQVYAETDSIADRNTSGDYTPTNTDSWVVGYPTNGNTYLSVFGSSSNSGISTIVGGGGNVTLSLTEGETYYLGAMPFSGTGTLQSDNAEETFTAGTDVPLGTYLVAARVKETGSNENFEVENTTDSSTVDLDGNGVSEDISGSVTSDYQYFIRQIRVDSDDDGDTIRWRIVDDSNNVLSADTDELLLVPISLEVDSASMGPQDVAHNGFRPHNVDRVLRER